MEEDLHKIIFNQKFVIMYFYHNIEVYDNTNILTKKQALNFESEESITNIQFNPILSNIILVSFSKGYCKIYEILDKNIQEKIMFEGINEDIIVLSKFNYLNTNIIASLSNFKSIIIWDVNDIKYVNVIKIIKDTEIDKIINFKWNRTLNDSLEVKTKKDIKLVNIRNGKDLRILENTDEIQSVIFLEKENIVIKENIIEKTNIENNIIYYLECKNNIYSNDSIIKDNILIIFSLTELIFIDILKMQLIKNIIFKFKNIYDFYNSDKDNEIILYYYNNRKVEQKSIKLEKKLSKINNSDMKNINNHFYDKYQKKIYKYISLLNFEENIL